MTQDEELISNISYTNSDFRTIFPQLLDTAKKLSNKWDPSLSNESDPGNILLKEAAIIGDKNNYHIDKNVLECFPLSATQQSTARQLYDLAGYNMHWYRSGYAIIQLSLLKSITNINSENDLELDYIKLEPGRQVCDSTGEYVYSLLQSTTLSTLGRIESVEAIQGTIEQYEINGDYDITIDNLDENLRIYFPQNYIAENGVFVYDKDVDVQNVGYHNNYDATSQLGYWGKVDNLTQYPAKSKVFKFGLDLDSDKCYIQFPEEIISLIGSGLHIYYTITKGNDGNVKASVLNSFVNDIVEQGDEDSVSLNQYIKVSNLPSIGGVDPETLQSAYKNYKRTIGTYDTLVSRRDYNNAIYNLKKDDEKNLNLVSNAFVTDRVSDINCSQSVIVNDGSKPYSKNYVKEDSLNSYDVVLYLLKQPTSLLNIDDYNETFKPDLSKTTLNIIEQDLDEYKSVQHNLQYISDNSSVNDPYFDITNIIRLNGNITTYYRVTKAEAKQIEANVTNKLIQLYNSRELVFGDQIYYDDLISAIKSADDRIRNVNLDIPNYEPYIQKASDSVPVSLYQASPDRSLINNETIAKMVLSGNVQLFNFLDDFQVDFGQTDAHEIPNVATITTTNEINLSTTYKELDENDIIQIVTPNIQVDKTYSATVRYSYRGATVNSGEVYVLTDNDVLYVIYANEIGTLGAHKVPTNTAIRPQGFQLTSTGTSQINPEDTKGESKLLAGQSLEEVVISQGTINGLSDNIYYYIVTNSIKTEQTNDEDGYKQFYNLILKKDEPYVLQENEYFIYTSQNLNGLIVLGSGTSLQLSDDFSENTYILQSPILDLDKVYETSFEDIFNETDNIWDKFNAKVTRIDNDIITLTEGDSIKCTNPVTLRNILQDINGIITYKFKEDNTEYVVNTIAGLAGYTIKARSTMILQANSIGSQTLNGNQTIIFNNDTTNPISKDNNDKYYSILFSYPINILGGNNIDVRILNESTGKYEALLSALVFTQDNPTSDSTIKRDKSIISINNNITFNFTFNKTFDISNSQLYDGTEKTGVAYYLIPIRGSLTANQGNNGTLSVGISNGSVDSIYHELNNSYTARYSKQVDVNSTYVFDDILVITSSNNLGASALTFTFTNLTSDSRVEIGYISRVHNYNTQEIDMEKVANNNYYSYKILGNCDTIPGTTFTKNYQIINSKLITLPGWEYFDWTYRVPNSNKVLQPLAGESYFNVNHVYNECTIPKIDLNKSTIKVNPSNIII